MHARGAGSGRRQHSFFHPVVAQAAPRVSPQGYPRESSWGPPGDPLRGPMCGFSLGVPSDNPLQLAWAISLGPPWVPSVGSPAVPGRVEVFGRFHILRSCEHFMWIGHSVVAATTSQHSRAEQQCMTHLS